MMNPIEDFSAFAKKLGGNIQKLGLKLRKYHFGGDEMSIEKHLEALKAKHEALDLEIEQEANRPLPDQVLISNLKKQKLKLKEEIEQITAAE